MSIDNKNFMSIDIKVRQSQREKPCKYVIVILIDEELSQYAQL